MESWRLVWRQGFCPGLPTAGLELLEAALITDDPKLTQGSTTTPPPLQCVEDWPCEAADAIATCGIPDAGGWGEATIGQIEEFFAKACFDADQRLKEPAACRYFLNWYDDEPRDSMREQLRHEVQRELNDRAFMTRAVVPAEFTAAVLDPDGLDPTTYGVIADWYDDRGHPGDEEQAEMFRLRMRRLEGV